MALSMSLSNRTCRLSTAAKTGIFGGRPTLNRTALTVNARFRGYNCNLDKVPSLQRHETDCGSAEVQIARLTARIEQLTKHLEMHKKDNGTRRGMQALLAQRKSLQQYLFRKDRSAYDKVCQELGLRNTALTKAAAK